MFWKINKDNTPNYENRKELLADCSLKDLAHNVDKSERTEEPWASFLSAMEKYKRGQKKSAIEILKGITRQKNLHPQNYIHAYFFMKQLGHIEYSRAQVLGIVVEIGNKDGYELLVVYENLFSFHYDSSGFGLGWERPDDSLDKTITPILDLSEELIKSTTPIEKIHPKPVKDEMIRLNLLTSKGLFSGEAPMDLTGYHPIGNKVLKATTTIQQAIAEKFAPHFNDDE